MEHGGRYGLVHPHSEAVYVANRLLFLYGDQPDFQSILDDLYGKTTPLLDAVAHLLIPASSLEGLASLWGDIEGEVSHHVEASVLSRQMHEIKAAGEMCELQCPWAPYPLLYTLGTEHQPRRSKRQEQERAHQLGLPELNPHVPEHIPNWSGGRARVHSGLLAPNVAGYAGRMGFSTEGESMFQEADAGPHISFYNAGPKGYAVPDGATLEEIDSLALDYQERYQQIQNYFRSNGMVKPTPRRDLDQKIAWLFLDLTHPKVGWRTKAKWINRKLKGREFNYDTIAQHVNRLRRLLLIEPPPWRPERFG